MNTGLEGDKELERALRQMKDEVKKRLPVALRSGATIIENDAKERCPYLTGNLRRSLHTEIEEEGPEQFIAKIGTNVEYGVSVEYGIGQRAQPYLRPAFDTNKGNAEKEVMKVINILARKFRK